MKFTNQFLKQIIIEEMQNLLNEQLRKNEINESLQGAMEAMFELKKLLKEYPGLPEKADVYLRKLADEIQDELKPRTSSAIIDVGAETPMKPRANRPSSREVELGVMKQPRRALRGQEWEIDKHKVRLAQEGKRK
jgi:hypothetical protein